MLKILLSVLLTLGLISCSIPNSKPSNPDLPFEFAPEASLGKVNLYLIRAYSEPTLRGMKILVNGENVAKLGNFKYTWLQVDPGKYVIQTDWASDTKQAELKIEVDVQKETFVAFGSRFTDTDFKVIGNKYVYQTTANAQYSLPNRNQILNEFNGYEPIKK